MFTDLAQSTIYQTEDAPVVKYRFISLFYKFCI